MYYVDDDARDMCIIAHIEKVGRHIYYMQKGNELTCISFQRALYD